MNNSGQIDTQAIMGAIDDLAAITARGFERVEERLDIVENTMATKTDLLHLSDRFVTQKEFENLAIRVLKIEEKEKKKLN